MTRARLHLAVVGLLCLTLACSGGDAREGQGGESGGRGGDGHHGGERRTGSPWAAGDPAAAVPVEVAAAQRRTIASYIETNGTLEAETEVDVVARLPGPIAVLKAEEGEFVAAGALLARIEDEEYRADLEIAAVNLEETRMAYERAQNLRAEELISNQDYDTAKSAYDTARAQHEAAQLQMRFTEIRAPFAGWVVTRYVEFAQQVGAGTPLYRLSDFTPLLCPIQVPERELARLRKGQPAYVTVEPFPGERFKADVLRISPVVDAASGTIKVTLEVDAERRLRPGMFARVFVETETRAGAVVVPKAALSLESLGDAVYVATEGKASRRDVQLGFREGDFVQILEGVAAGEQVVVVGQEGLSDGTPIQILVADGRPQQSASTAPDADGVEQRRATAGGRPGTGSPAGRGRPDISSMTPEQIEGMKERMRARGMTDEEIEERITRMRAAASGGGDARP